MDDKLIRRWDTALATKINPLDYFAEHVIPAFPLKRISVLNSARTSTICPFHVDTDPSFHYWKSRSIFHCFGCGFTGGILTSHRKVMSVQANGASVSFDDALRHLLGLYGQAHLLDVQQEIEAEFNFFDNYRQKVNVNALLKSASAFSLSTFNSRQQLIIGGGLSIRARVELLADLDIQAGLMMS